MKQFFTQNRKNLFEKMENNSSIVLYSGNLKRKSGDEDYPFCVNKNFYYLTGLEMPKIYLVMEKIDGNNFTKIITPTFEKSVWITPTYKINEVKKISGIDDVIYYNEPFKFSFKENLTYYTDFEHFEFYNTLENKENFKDCFKMVSQLRAIKSNYEIKQIEKAIDITHKGLIKLFSNFSSCNYEYQAQALFEGEIIFNNSQDLAFSTIAAGGKNACILHYSKNSDKLNQGDMVLFDLGARYNQYSADISRTIVYKSKFSPLQTKLYNMVLKAQKIGLKFAKPGITIFEINNAIIDFYFEELKKLNLVKTREDVKKYYMHNIGHSLGLSTHDEGLPRSEKLVAGNVITMEPGIYIPEYNIGIRIEDDVLITEKGNRVLSKKIPKTIEELENLVK